MRIKFNIWFLPIGSIVAVVGSLGSTKLTEGGSLWWWFPSLLFVGMLIFCLTQAVLWYLWERKN